MTAEHALAQKTLSTVCDRSVFLRDGGRITIRSVQPEDRSGVRALFERLSPATLALRFHGPGPRITDAILDGVTAGHALVAEREGTIVALASYYPEPDGRHAEAAIVVEDTQQGRGIGSALATFLYRDACSAGIVRLRANVQGSNRGMLKLLRSLALPMTRTWDHGVIEFAIELQPEAA